MHKLGGTEGLVADLQRDGALVVDGLVVGEGEGAAGLNVDGGGVASGGAADVAAEVVRR